MFRAVVLGRTRNVIGRRLGVAATIALTLTLALGSPVSASPVLGRSGLIGDWGTYDDPGQPGGRCGYSAADTFNFAYLRWIKVFPVKAGARDITGGVDWQRISWRVAIQRATNAGGPWTTVAHSARQKRRGNDNYSINFDPIKVHVTGHPGQYFRAVSTLKWWRHGVVEGHVTFRTEYYSNKWTVGSPDYIAHNFCVGQAE